MALPQESHSTIEFPAPSEAQVWLDFDGTLTRRDVLDDLIAAYAIDDSWKAVEDLWQCGKIGSRQCLEQEFALLRISDAELMAFLDQVELDPGVLELLELLRKMNVPHAIVSDGIDLFIRRILRRHQMDTMVIRSNTIIRDASSMQLSCPWSSGDCASAAAHCKCASVANLSRAGRRSIYVGDGRSDLCPARKANVIYAKGALAKALALEDIKYRPFDTLLDVAADMALQWSRHLAHNQKSHPKYTARG